MDFKVVVDEQSPRRVVGVFTRTTMERAGEDCPDLWAQLMPAVTALAGGHTYDAYGVSTDFREDGSFVYWAALDAPTELLLRPDWVDFLPPARMRLDAVGKTDIPGGTYAVAVVPSLADLMAAYAFLYGEWGKDNPGYSPNMAACSFEFYPKTWREDDSFLLYVPVHRK